MIRQSSDFVNKIERKKNISVSLCLCGLIKNNEPPRHRDTKNTAGGRIYETASKAYCEVLSLLACALLLLLPGCSGAPQEQASTAGKELSRSALVDSADNRRVEAEKCVAAYPAAEFGADLTELAAEIVGREVAEDARSRLRAQLSAEDFRETRIQILTRNFNARELAALAEIYRSSEGKSLMRKMPHFDNDWRSYLTPPILESLSNVPQK